MANSGTSPTAERPGVTILVLGILSLVGFGCLTGIPAWIMGNRALANINSGLIDAGERGLVDAGRILGIVSTSLSGCGLAIFFALLSNATSPPTFAPDMDKVLARMQSAMTESHKRRKGILNSAIAERKRNPKRTYAVLAKELNASKGKKVKWHKDPLVPLEGCQTYTFSGGNGMLTVIDSCGSDTLYGWPPKEGTRSQEIIDLIKRVPSPGGTN